MLPKNKSHYINLLGQKSSINIVENLIKGSNKAKPMTISLKSDKNKNAKHNG